MRDQTEFWFHTLQPKGRVTEVPGKEEFKGKNMEEMIKGTVLVIQEGEEGGGGRRGATSMGKGPHQVIKERAGSG